jgi:hypothetical protein
MKELLLMWVEPAYWRTALVLAAVGCAALGYLGARVCWVVLRRVPL